MNILIKILPLILCICFLAGCRAIDNQPQKATPSNKTTESDSFTNSSYSVFKTTDISRITFYGYYGSGTGSTVPKEHMSEIINWLSSFVIDKKIENDSLLSPGTNTVFVEIEYSDGTIIKNGLNTATVNGNTYYTKYAKEPECFHDILSLSSLN